MTQGTKASYEGVYLIMKWGFGLVQCFEICSERERPTIVVSAKQSDEAEPAFPTEIPWAPLTKQLTVKSHQFSFAPLDSTLALGRESLKPFPCHMIFRAMRLFPCSWQWRY